jgi:hypothetical protein
VPRLGVRNRLAAHTRLRGGYLMAVTRNEVVVVLEQVENRFLIVTDLTAEGGTTFRPAAVTGAHRDGEKLPVSRMPIDAVCVVPGASATVPNFDVTREAALPICVPLLVTADTGG